MVGKTFSHYRIVEELGKGGMGVVYKAHDVQLERTVALKFLATHLVVDAEVRERFIREAKAAAAVHHPNICTIHEIAEAEGRLFIAMAYIEGQSLEAKIEDGPLKLTEALDIAQQVAEGLQAAHEKGTVHRDIKPGNIMLTPRPDGRLQVTIMDFGLARLADRSRLTLGDRTLGTVTYMSPEQTLGTEVDQRTDIWSLGVVLYEIISGSQPFRGHYDQAVMYAITSEEPEPLTAVRTGVPLELEWIVAKCLAKAPADRYQSASELIVDLRLLHKKLDSESGPRRQTGVASVLSKTVGAVAEKKRPDSRRRVERGLWGAALAMVAAFALWQWFHVARTAPELPLRRFSFAPAAGANQTVISPDGRFVAYVQPGGGSLWLQPLHLEGPLEIQGTTGAQGLAWSPDSKSIAFAMNKQLWSVSLGEGRPRLICDLPEDGFAGAGWSPTGDAIAFCIFRQGIFEAPAQGGTPRLIVENGPYHHTDSVSYLPNHKRVLLYTAYLQEAERHDIIVHDLASAERAVIASSSAVDPEPRYSPTGHILFVAAAKISAPLEALPFSLDTLQPSGEAFSVDRAAKNASDSNDGTLVFIDPGEIVEEKLVWRSRSGERLGEVGQPHDGAINHFRLSGNGRQVAVSAWSGDSYDLWIHEVTRPIKTRLTFAGQAFSPVWSPAGDQLAYVCRRADKFDVCLRSVGRDNEEVILSSPRREITEDWSPDGERLIYTVRAPETGRDLWYFNLNQRGDGEESAPLVQTRFTEHSGVVSPDGRYLAYSSNETGQQEIYVRPFPGGAGKWRISAKGGWQPRWAKSGKELFYVEGQTLMAVTVATSPAFTVGPAEALFTNGNLQQRLGPFVMYDASADGQRFLTIETRRDLEHPVIRVVQNWIAEFRQSR